MLINIQKPGEEQPKLVNARVRLATAALLFVFLAFLRSPEAIRVPILYAEDGVWLMRGLNEGLIALLLTARPDYPTLINGLVLLVGATLSSLVSGNPLWLAANFIALVSYSVWGLTSFWLYFHFREKWGELRAVLAGLMFALLPLGTSSNEILGRGLQLGFLVPIWLFLLLESRRVASEASKLVIDLCIVVLSLTSPVVFMLMVAYVSGRVALRTIQRKELFDIARPILAAGLVLLSIFAFRSRSVTDLSETLIWENIPQTFLARTILYPLSGPVYQRFDDAPVLLFSISILLALLAGWLLISQHGSRDSGFETSFLIIIMLTAQILIFIITRPGLTLLVWDFQGTFPDRYFIGVNAFVILLLLSLASPLTEKWRGKSFAQLSANLGVLVIVVLFFAKASLSFEITGPRFPIAGQVDMQERLCSALKTEPIEGKYLVQIEPQPNWNLLVDPHLLEDLPCRD
jgi:hypothetical protein